MIKTVLLFLLLSFGLYSQSDTSKLSMSNIGYITSPDQYGLKGSISLKCSKSDAIDDFYKYNLIFIFVDGTFVYLATSEIENNTVKFILRQDQYKDLMMKQVKGILFNLRSFNLTTPKFIFQ